MTLSGDPPSRRLYEKQGYLTDLPVLTEAELETYRAAFSQLEDRYGKGATQMKIVDQHFHQASVWELASHPRVLDWVEYAMGPDIVLLATHFLCKYPGMGAQIVTWHQDTYYWCLDPPRACTIWLAIDDVDRENGCMQVLPFSHKWGTLAHLASDREDNLLRESQAVEDGLIDESAAVDLCLKAGQVSLHDGLLLHSSRPNRSSRRRCGLTLRYTSPDVRFTGTASRSEGLTAETAPRGFRPILLRGQDRFGSLPWSSPPFPGTQRDVLS